MKIAKASEADIEMAIDLVSALETLGHRFCPAMPKTIEVVSETEDLEYFDKFDDAQCGRALRHLLDIANRGSMLRVVWGMAAVVHPKNNIVDPNADTLEVNPELLRRFDAAPAVVLTLRLLYETCEGMDAEREAMEHSDLKTLPTEKQYQQAMAAAHQALQVCDLAATTGAAGVQALALLAVNAADYYGQVLNIDQVPLQPLAMGHYNTTINVRPKRELASQAQAEQGGAA